MPQSCRYIAGRQTKVASQFQLLQTWSNFTKELSAMQL
jgi:hypothetical protein